MNRQYEIRASPNPGLDAGRPPKPEHSASPSAHSSTPPVNQERKMSTTATNKSGILAQQIHDEFLTCKICLEGFTNPKSLNCLHTFCEECIENHANSESSYKKYSDYREFTCPLCRKRTTLPTGGVKKLPDNFLVASLNEIIDRQKPSKYPYCDFCKLVSKKHKEATAKCLDCSKLLCKPCVEQHNDTKVTKNHNIFDIDIEKDIECKEHKDEVVRFYCETCESAICILCTFNDHKDHDITQFSDAVKKHKANIENLLMDCKNKLENFEAQIEIVNKCEKCIRSTEQKIRDVSIEMVSDVRNREKILIEQIHNMYGPETMALIEKRNDLRGNLQGLKSTVQLTELILNGKDMELLLLQKEVIQKLESLSKTTMEELPKTTSKVISFVPGMVDMGYIFDQDRPLLSAARRCTKSTSLDFRNDVFSMEDFQRTSESQTDCCMIKAPDRATNTTLILTTETATQTDDFESTVQIVTTDNTRAQSAVTDDDESVTNRRRRRRDRPRVPANESETYTVVNGHKGMQGHSPRREIIQDGRESTYRARRSYHNDDD